MNDAPDEDYAQQCDPVQPKSRRPRPKKEVTKVVPAKIFDGIKAQPKKKKKACGCPKKKPERRSRQQ